MALIRLPEMCKLNGNYLQPQETSIFPIRFLPRNSKYTHYNYTRSLQLKTPIHRHYYHRQCHYSEEADNKYQCIGWTIILSPDSKRSTLCTYAYRNASPNHLRPRMTIPISVSFQSDSHKQYILIRTQPDAPFNPLSADMRA